MECNGYTRFDCFECGALYDHQDQQPSRRSRRRREERRRRAHTRKAVALLLFACIGITSITAAAITITATSGAKDKPAVTAINTPAVEDNDPSYIAEPVLEESHAETAFNALNVPMDTDLQSSISDLCQQYGAPFELIMAIMDNESDFKSDAISSDGHDYGLMQIRDVNHSQLTADLGVTDFLDPLQNAKCGIYIISGYIKKYEDLNLALMAYNCGETGARKLWDKGTYSTEYSRGIIRQMDEFVAEREG